MDRRPSYEEFVTFMVKLYSPVYHPELRLQYVDSEGDNIDVTSQLEWEEMFKELSDEKIFKIKVVEGSGKYFKDGPEPVVAYAYDEPLKKPIHPDNVGELRSRVPKCLQELFLEKKILPHNLPSFLEGVVKISYLPNNVVDIDVDVSKLSSVLFKKGLEYLDQKEYEKGRALFQALLYLTPEDSLCNYNLACAESLLGNREVAVTILRHAVELGYDNLSHMLGDTDLDNIKNMKEFFEIVTELKVGEKTSEMIFKLPVKELEPVKEPVKEQKEEPEPVKEPEPVNEPEPKKEPEPKQEPEPKKPNEPIYVPEITIPIAPVSYANPLFQKWEAELTILHDVGYFDDDLLVSYLESTKGSVEQTVLALLDL